MRRVRKAGRAEVGLVPLPVYQARLADIRPSPENDTLYRPIDHDAEDFRQLVESVRRDGVKEPLVLTLDDFILSGHRRHAAAGAAGLTEVPVRRENVLRGDGGGDFSRLLASYNQQRLKTLEEQTREALVLSDDIDPDEAHSTLLAYRQQKIADTLCPPAPGQLVKARAGKGRKRITDAKAPFLDAIQSVVNGLRRYWPISERRVHYGLLDLKPLKHASKPGSAYCNDRPSAKALSDLLTRARLAGLVDINAIGDDTRPFTDWVKYNGVGPYVRQELDELFAGYAYDLQADQPAHIEVIAEKLTVQGVVWPVCQDYRVPLTISRGWGSIPPRRDLVNRFHQSGKDRLVLILVTDADPDGEGIAANMPASLERDFGIDADAITVVKPAIRPDQAAALGLPPAGSAKGSRMKWYRRTFGTGDVWELEAITPEALRRLLDDAICGVIDVPLFNAAVEREKMHAAHLARVRRTAMAAMEGLADMEDGDRP